MTDTFSSSGVNSLLGQQARGATGASGVSVEGLERTGRRITMLQQYAPELVTSTASGALALAESNVPDGAMLDSASSAVGYSNLQRLKTDLSDESPENARAMWAATPDSLRKALRNMGYKPPPEPKKKGNRWGINLPDFLPGPNELTIARDTPVLGQLGNVQAGLGEGLEAIRGAGGQALRPFAWAGELPSHALRALAYTQEEGFTEGQGFGAIAKRAHELVHAWGETDSEDGYVRPAFREKARRALGGDETTYRLAHYVAMKRTPQEIIESEGLDPGSAEATQLIAKLQSEAGTSEFRNAVHQMSVGQVSAGRALAEAVGVDNTDSGWGMWLSGTLDAGFLFVDPTIIGGKVVKTARAGRYAFTLEHAGDVERGYRFSDLALLGLREREGTKVGTLATDVGRVRPWEMRRGDATLRWADRVAEGFRTNQFGKLQRDLPAVSTALNAMSNYHLTRLAEGRRGLDSTLGVIEWLQNRDGMLAVAGSRLAGGSPLAEGLRIPSLTVRDRAVLRAKGGFEKTIDWTRTQYDPWHGKTFTEYMQNVVKDLGSPPTLTRQLGRWSRAHTFGSAGRTIAALTAHTPYDTVLPLYGEQAVPEFTRLVNSGIFAGMDRSVLDSYIDDFVRNPTLVNRSNKVEQFLDQLFKLGGVHNEDFTKRFVGRMRQAYALPEGKDVVGNEGIISRASRMVDAQHANALEIPAMRDFFAGSYKANWLRAMFHNPGAAQIDAVLGRAWKPSVLMRIGFIPRAAGEEALHYILKHGPRTYLGGKGAIWEVNEELGHSLRAELTEAQALGQTDKVNRLTQQLAESTGALSPLRSLMAGSDRMFSHLLASSKNPFPWRDRVVAKVEAFDPSGTRGVVSGLEAFANRMSLFSSDVFGKVARAGHVPSKATIGGWMASAWDPRSAQAARDMLENPWIARSFAEQISGSTMTPFEFRGQELLGGAPTRTVRVSEIRGGVPVVEEVALRPDRGNYDVLDRVATQDPAFYESIYARHNWVRHDRVGNAVLENVLPRWVGPWGPKATRSLGYGKDTKALREALNTAWAHAGDDVKGKRVLDLARRYLDGEEFDAGKGWFGGQLKRLFADSGVDLKANKFLTLLDDPKVPAAAKRWLLYDNVNPELLVDDMDTLLRKMNNVARARLSRPDMATHLSESRLYANGGPTLATPIVQGMHKVYVPLMPADYEAIPLGEDFIAMATQRIVRIGGYNPAVAEGIARKAATASSGALTDVGEMAMRPLAAWGASDPRVAEAVMAAAEQATGVRPTFGILTVPKGVVEQSAGIYPQGLTTDAKAWQLADDWQIDPWRMARTEATDKPRRFIQLEVDGQWWDDMALDTATDAFKNKAKGTTRRYSYDGGKTWTTKAPKTTGPVSGAGTPFSFVDTVGKPAPEDLANAHKLPGLPPADGWKPTGRQVSPGLGEAEALEKVADSTMDELIETLTTRKRPDLDDDVLHEVVEPLLRPDKVRVDAAGNRIEEPGYNWNHLVAGTSVDRLPLQSYGPTQSLARDYTWRKFVEEWFSGPVNKAISSIIRKPMFLHVYGEQLRNQEGIAALFVDRQVREGALAAAHRVGLPSEALDDFARNAKHATKDTELADLISTMSERTGVVPGEQDLQQLRYFANQRNHGLDLARENALNRSFQLIIPFIDDHRVRSAFQQYVGNFIPFLFAEEQFAKRWVRSVAESPEMIRKGQLAMNGIRDMGVIRKDNQGRDIFNYPLVGEAAQAVGNVVPDIFGVDIAVPYPVAMTGDVGYTLPGFGDQMGVPSVGPLVAMSVEFLSRQYPELAGIEERVVGRGANQPYWHYIFPSGASRIVEAAFGDMDQGQLASLNLQTIQMMALNGQLPPEDATPEEINHFQERVRGQVRWLSLMRAGFGLNAPAAPQIKFATEDLSDEFNKLLQADIPMEEAVQLYLANHPDIQPEDLLATTVSRSETEFSGLDMPTDKAFKWLEDHRDLVEAWPAAASWLIPRAEADDNFSFRAWNQQLAVGLRKRKTPDSFLNDIYFSQAARDYFDARQLHEETLLTATGGARRQANTEWDTWKKAYFRQHPVFEDMLADPTRQQRRRDALDQLTMLSADPEGPVPAEMREMMQHYDNYRLTTAGLRGDRRGAVVAARKRLTEETKAWMLWYVQRFPHLAALYMRTIEPELAEADEDAVASGVTD